MISPRPHRIQKATLTAISADFGDLWRIRADAASGFRIYARSNSIERRAVAATENQGVASSNLALGTRPDRWL